MNSHSRCYLCGPCSPQLLEGVALPPPPLAEHLQPHTLFQSLQGGKCTITLSDPKPTGRADDIVQLCHETSVWSQQREGKGATVCARGELRNMEWGWAPLQCCGCEIRRPWRCLGCLASLGSCRRHPSPPPTCSLQPAAQSDLTGMAHSSSLSCCTCAVADTVRTFVQLFTRQITTPKIPCSHLTARRKDLTYAEVHDQHGYMSALEDCRWSPFPGTHSVGQHFVTGC